MATRAGVKEATAGPARARGPLSYSSFHLYEECPQRWKFIYLDEVPEAPRSYFSFGRSMHTALEALVAPLVPGPGESRKRGQTSLMDFALPGPKLPEEGRELPSLMPVEELLRAYEGAWIKEGYASPAEERRYFLVGRDLLVRYHGILRASPLRAIAVEKHLVGEMDGIPIHGILDRLDAIPGGGLEVLDYKTSRELSVRDALTSDQLTFYQVLVEGNYDRPVEALTLYHLRSLTPLTSPPRRPSEVARLRTRVGMVSDGMASANYEPRPGPPCNRCEFKGACPAFAPGTRRA